MESMRLGGAERSLVTLLTKFDYNKYEVDLFLFEHDGELLDKIPKQVNILSVPKKYVLFRKNRKISWLSLLLQGYYKQSIAMCCYLIGVLYSRYQREPLYIGWKYIQTLFDTINKEYDVSISYLERKSMYFNADKVYAKRKIGFIHNNYERYPYDKVLEKKYFQVMDYIPTVSEHCKDVLVNLFPQYEKKFLVIQNMILEEEILSLSEEKIADRVLDNRKKIVSVGRLVKQKGFDIAISVCRKLVDSGIDIVWYIVGEGEERSNLEYLIRENQLENNFFLVGADKNPYKWMKIADVYVQPSRFEGFPMTILEVQQLNKYIVTSDIPEFKSLVREETCHCARTIEDYVSIIGGILLLDKKVVQRDKIRDNNSLQQLYGLIEKE